MPGKTLNAVLVETMTAPLPGGQILAVVTLFSEGILLVVAAQAGFIDGPRVLANMAVDNWMPRRFAALSDRLTTQNGIVLMGAASLLALLYTGGDVGKLVVMYSINVFLTFSLSMFGMARKSIADRKTAPGLDPQGDAVRGRLRAVRDDPGHHRRREVQRGRLDHAAGHRRRGRPLLRDPAALPHGAHAPGPALSRRAQHRRARHEPRRFPSPTRKLPTAAILVPSYGGVGIHTVLNVFRAFPNHFKNLVFISVGVIDSGGFKGADCVESLESTTQAMLKKYLSLATELGIPSTYRMGIGTEAVLEAEKLCATIMTEFPLVTFIGGKVVFAREQWFQRILHNETATAIQKRLYWMGATMVILPAKVQ